MAETVAEQIAAHIEAQPERKRADLATLHRLVTGILPEGRLWFLDGRNAEGRVVTNPNIGYGSFTMRRRHGADLAFYQVGLSATTTGLSVYLMTFADKTYLAETYGAALGKASVTGYCVRFRSLRDIDQAVLEAAIRDAAARG